LAQRGAPAQEQDKCGLPSRHKHRRVRQRLIIAFGAPTATAGSAFESGEVFVATETKTGTWKLTATATKPNPVSDGDLGGGDHTVTDNRKLVRTSSQRATVGSAWAWRPGLTGEM
jgi:hypothetical protein